MNLILCDDEQIFLDSLHQKIMNWAKRSRQKKFTMIMSIYLLFLLPALENMPKKDTKLMRCVIYISQYLSKLFQNAWTFYGIVGHLGVRIALLLTCQHKFCDCLLKTSYILKHPVITVSSIQ